MVFRPSEFRTNDTGPKIEKDGYMAKKNCPKNLLNKRSLCSFALSWQIRCNRSVKEKLLSLAKQISCLEVFSSCLSASIEEHLPFQRSRKEEKEWEREKKLLKFLKQLLIFVGCDRKSLRWVINYAWKEIVRIGWWCYGEAETDWLLKVRVPKGMPTFGGWQSTEVAFVLLTQQPLV